MGNEGIWLWDSANSEWVKGKGDSDGHLQVDVLSLAGTSKVRRASAGATVKRMTATGQVVSGAATLFWIHENPSAGSGVYELTDATAGGGSIIFDHFSTNREGHMVNFDPPIDFDNGIWLETFTSLTSLVVCYE